MERILMPFNRKSESISPDDVKYAFARQRVEEARRQKITEMPIWLKNNRSTYRDKMRLLAQKCYEDIGIWFFARGSSRDTDEQESMAVWGDLLFFDKLENLPGYSEKNHRQAIEFWRSWQNLKTGRLYNPLYQDPQNPEIKRVTAGNRNEYSPDKINRKYIPNILAKLGSELPMPCNTETFADTCEDTFDRLWGEIKQWNTAPAGIFPVNAAYALDNGNLNKIPQVEAGMSALVRAYNRETGMWRPETLPDFPWSDYHPSSGFKIIARLCGYVGMENFPEAIFKTAIDNLIAHKAELHTHPAMARNYGETMAHYLMMGDYRHDELLDAMEECLEGFRDPKLWDGTDTSCYCIFGSGLIGAFMNWKDLPFDQALMEWHRFVQGCNMNWRFVADPYGNWVNVIPKESQEIFGHPKYDPQKYGLKARNKEHWSKKITELTPQQDIALKSNTDGNCDNGTFIFALTDGQLAKSTGLYLKATWSGAFDISINGIPVKQVRYNLPDLSAGWHIPVSAVKTLHAGKNIVGIKLTGPGKEQKPGTPISNTNPFIRIGIINWQ